MTKLVNEQARMTIGSKEYIAHASKIRNLNGILAQHRQEIAAVSKGWSMASIGDAFNRYQALAMGFAATLTATVMGFKIPTLLILHPDHLHSVNDCWCELATIAECAANSFPVITWFICQLPLARCIGTGD